MHNTRLDDVILGILGKGLSGFQWLILLSVNTVLCVGRGLVALQAPQPVQAFEAAPRPVSIGEFREFVLADKGYTTPDFWRPSDFDTLASKRRCPSHWTLTVSCSRDAREGMLFPWASLLKAQRGGGVPSSDRYAMQAENGGGGGSRLFNTRSALPGIISCLTK